MGLRILLDLGLYQGVRAVAREMNQALPADVGHVDAVILSHGHLDHCGKLPMLARAGYRGAIYCTAATAAVAKIVLSDSAEIQEEDARYLNEREHRAGQDAVTPLYTRGDLPAVFKAFKLTKLGERTHLGNEVHFTLFDAGHILGSTYIVLDWKEGGQERRLLFTADIGRYDTPILRDPTTLAQAVDVVITESTYGNVKHAPMGEVGPQLLEAVKQCVANRSRLLVPSFAVGRTQTILWYVQKFISEGAIPEIPIFVDSPMGIEVSKVTSEFRDSYDEETNRMIGTRDIFGMSKVTFTRSAEESRRINNEAGPCVIIASSPTCEFGRILHHLRNSAGREKDLVVFVGWTPPNTLGRRLQDGQRRARIYDRWYDVRFEVRTIHGLSAHADGDELIRFLSPTLGAKTTAFVVHGEELQAETFAARLLAAGIGQAHVPAMTGSVRMFGTPGEIPATSGEAPSDSREGDD